MMPKFTVVLTALFFTMSSINADNRLRGLRSSPPGDGFAMSSINADNKLRGLGSSPPGDGFPDIQRRRMYGIGGPKGIFAAPKDPAECTSVCSLDGITGAGVLVTETGPDDDEHQACLPPEWAISLIAGRDGRFQCVTE